MFGTSGMALPPMEVEKVEGEHPRTGWDKPQTDGIFQAGKGPGAFNCQRHKNWRGLDGWERYHPASYNYDAQLIII